MTTATEAMFETDRKARDRRAFEYQIESFLNQWKPEDRRTASEFEAQLISLMRQVYARCAATSARYRDQDHRLYAGVRASRSQVTGTAAVTNHEARAIAARLSKRMLLILIEHGDGPQPLVVGRELWNTVLSLRNRNLVKMSPSSAIRPKETIATTLGRQVIAAALAIEADKLTVMEFLCEESLSHEASTPVRSGQKRSEPVR